MTNEEKLLNYCLQQHTYFKTVLLKPLKDDWGSTLLENDALNQDAIHCARWIIITNVCLALLLSVDEVIEFVDNLNIKEMLK